MAIASMMGCLFAQEKTLASATMIANIVKMKMRKKLRDLGLGSILGIAARDSEVD